MVTPLSRVVVASRALRIFDEKRAAPATDKIRKFQNTIAGFASKKTDAVARAAHWASKKRSAPEEIEAWMVRARGERPFDGARTRERPK
jgi:hypothetical protein